MKRNKKRLEKRLGDIFYTMIIASESFPLLSRFGSLSVRIEQASRLAYSIFVVDDRRNLIITSLISVNPLGDYYIVKKFNNWKGTKIMREALEKMFR